MLLELSVCAKNPLTGEANRWGRESEKPKEKECRYAGNGTYRQQGIKITPSDIISGGVIFMQLTEPAKSYFRISKCHYRREYY